MVVVVRRPTAININTTTSIIIIDVRPARAKDNIGTVNNEDLCTSICVMSRRTRLMKIVVVVVVAPVRPPVHHLGQPMAATGPIFTLIPSARRSLSPMAELMNIMTTCEAPLPVVGDDDDGDCGAYEADDYTDPVGPVQIGRACAQPAPPDSHQTH